VTFQVQKNVTVSAYSVGPHCRVSYTFWCNSFSV